MSAGACKDCGSAVHECECPDPIDAAELIDDAHARNELLAAMRTGRIYRTHDRRSYMRAACENIAAFERGRTFGSTAACRDVGTFMVDLGVALLQRKLPVIVRE